MNWQPATTTPKPNTPIDIWTGAGRITDCIYSAWHGHYMVRNGGCFYPAHEAPSHWLYIEAPLF